MIVDIITPDTKIFSGEAQLVTLPGVEGSFGILANHAPLIATLKKGDIKVTDAQNKEESFSISGGVVEVLNNKVIVLAEN